MNGIGRSINVRYTKSVLNPIEQVELSKERLSEVSQTSYSAGELTTQNIRSDIPHTTLDKSFVPTRIQLTQSKMSSPGLLELVGDPTTIKVLLALLGSLVLLRGQDIRKSIAARGQQPEIVQTLSSLGYSEREIIAVRDYLNDDLLILIDRLEVSRAQLAPGDNLDVTE